MGPPWLRILIALLICAAASATPWLQSTGFVVPLGECPDPATVVRNRVNFTTADTSKKFKVHVKARATWGVQLQLRLMKPNGDTWVDERWMWVGAHLYAPVGAIGQVYGLLPGQDNKIEPILLHEALLVPQTEPFSWTLEPCGPFEEAILQRQAATFPLFVLILCASVSIYASWCLWLRHSLFRHVGSGRFSAASLVGDELDFPYLLAYLVDGFFPFVGSAACLAVTLQYNFHSATWTECTYSDGTVNFLPSISASISDVPQRYIWRGMIAMVFAMHPFHAVVAFACSKRGWGGFDDEPEPRGRLWLRRVVALLWLIEQFGLLLITVVSSTDDNEVHQVGFVAFAIAAVLRQPLSCLALRWTCNEERTPLSQFNFKVKCAFMVANTVSLMGAIACYVWQESVSCVDYVYSAFAFFEWMFVWTNIFFHQTIIFDLGEEDWRVRISPSASTKAQKKVL